MPHPQIALIIPLGSAPVDPGYGIPGFGRPGGGVGVSPPIYHPGHPDHGLPSYPDQGLPDSGDGPVVSPPIFHPGHPDHGLPSRPGRPTRPDNSLPPIPGIPDQGLPSVPGTPVQLPTPLPTPPGDLAQDLVIAVYAPGKGWKVTSWDLAAVQPPIAPSPAPKA